MDRRGLAAWKLPPIVAAIALPIVAGFYVGGPGLGMAVGALAAAAIIVLAVRNPPRGTIVPPPPHDDRGHFLVLVDAPLEGEGIDALARFVAEPGAEVRLIAPSRHRFLARWTSDVGAGRHLAQRNLVLTTAALAAAGVDATARVGDEDPVQMVEDELRTFPATEVIMVSAADALGGFGEGAAGELGARLRPPLRRIALKGVDGERPAPRSSRASGGAGIRTRIHGFGDRAHSR